MKKMFFKIIASTMAILLLASTISWKVEKHYCLGHLMDLSFFTPAQDCGMDMDLSENNTPQIQDENSCCNDEVIVVEGQTNLKSSINDFSFDQQLFLIAFANSYFHLIDFNEERNVPNENYPPLHIVKNIQLLDEVFLI